MTDFITVTGTLGTDPEHKVVGEGLDRTTFRLASSERRRRPDDTWEDTHTNWYTVTAFGRLATNLKVSLLKGQRITVTGKLRIRTYTREDNSVGTHVEIIASTVGHDLAFQTATANRRPKPAEGGAPPETGGFPDLGSYPGQFPDRGTAPASPPVPEARTESEPEPVPENEQVASVTPSYLTSASDESPTPF